MTRNVNSVTGVPEDVGEYSVVEAIEGLKVMQENKNKEIERHIVNLTEAVRELHRGNRCTGKCWLHDVDGHEIYNCGKFKSLNSESRLEAAKSRGICFKCLGGYHLARNCTSGSQCSVKTGNETCSRYHHPLLHDAWSHNGSDNASNVHNCKGNRALFAIGTASCEGRPVSILYDSGSDTTLIRHERAPELGLDGKTITMNMIKVGNDEDSFVTKEYRVSLQDKDGNIVEITAIGIYEISTRIKNVEMSKIVSLFNGVTPDDLRRPEGHVDILLGIDYCELLPEVVQTNGRLQLLKNAFGYCVRGLQPHTEGGNIGRQVTLKTNHATVEVSAHSLTRSSSDLGDKLDKFYAMENVDTECNPKCPSCLCRKCCDSNYSKKEERESALIGS